MGKQFISTVSASNAHKLDITSLVITAKYTITVSSDGYVSFWDNKQDEIHDPSQFVVREFVNKLGVHHVAAYENTLPNDGKSIKVVLLAFACFDGSVLFKYYIDDDIKTLIPLGVEGFEGQYWAPGFFKDPESKQDYFVCTHATGSSHVFDLKVTPVKSKSALEITFEKYGELNSNISSFPNSLSITTNEDKKAAIGYVNGDVQLYDIESLKLIYTFHSTDLTVSNNKKTGSTNSNSICRVLQFSPGGSLLAVARDNQSAGSITLYDVNYGENVGSLTTPSHSTANTIGGFAHEGWITGLSFDAEGKQLASCGYDKCVRVWNLDSREREATIVISTSDLEDDTGIDAEFDKSIASGVEFIRKGVRGGSGGDTNEGICVISFDRGVRWYREAGGI